jgi:hypothetical protein
MKEHRDASDRLSIDLGGDQSMFRVYTYRLEDCCGAKQVQQLDGLDQSYWHYDFEGTTIVLHWDAFAGICLHIDDGSRDDLLRRVAATITEPDAAPNAGK